MSDKKPALSLIATPGRRKAMFEVAREAERRSYAGIYVPSPFAGFAFCQALAHETKTIPFGTAIAPIYTRTPEDYAQAIGFIHEVSGGRFRFGIGVAHEPSLERMGIKPGKPLADTRRFVERVRATPRAGDLPPIVLATLRSKMLALGSEIGDGIVFANGARSHMAKSLSGLTEAQRRDEDFFIGDMIPTCVSDDIEAAKAVNRKTLTGYLQLPNYRNYWKEAGYREEMEAVEAAIAKGDTASLPSLMSDRWLADTTIFGPPAKVREEVQAWYEAGVRTPILVPSSAAGNALKAVEEVMAVFD